MRKLGMEYSRQHLAETVKVVDANGDNEIDFEEFMTLMNLTCQCDQNGDRDPDWELRRAFATFDCDGSGYIDVTELDTLMKKLGQNLTRAELQETLEVVDENGDGTVSFLEFKTIMVRVCCLLSLFFVICVCVPYILFCLSYLSHTRTNCTPFYNCRGINPCDDLFCIEEILL
jgi:Ca2+-binding EF-hand superfamily protein